MYNLYLKKETNFAILWIVIYCLVSIPIRGSFGDESIIMLAALAIIASILTIFVKKHKLSKKYGLNIWPKNPREFLYFIPLIILATGNLWGGFQITYNGVPQICAVISMFFIGYIEELIFRGFLFTGMIKEDGLVKAMIVSAVTFGIGHIVNLLSGQAGIETIVQVFFAIAWGFIFTTVFYKSKSLLPCILTHGVVNALSTFSAANIVAEWIYAVSTIAIAIVYCTFLLKRHRNTC